MLAILVPLVALLAPSHEQGTPLSPCPTVFQYEPAGNIPETPRRWYGVINLSTDNTLYSLWLNIVLDRKADILGNWIGDVTTTDNIDFKIENTTMRINPGPATSMRFFVQYSALEQTPRLQAIRLNGREICNANTPQPAVDQPDLLDTPVRRPEVITDVPTRRTSPTRPTSRPAFRPEDIPNTRPVQGRPQEPVISGPVYVRPSNLEPVPSSINGNGNNQIGNDFIPATASPVTRTPTIRPAVIDDDVSNDSSPDYFVGGTPTLIIPGSSNTGGTKGGEDQCGKVVLNNPIPLVINGTSTLEGQWPWQIALYQAQTVDFRYICGGTLVSHRHVITAAHCITRPRSTQKVNANTLTVYLGKHNLRTSVNGVQIKFVSAIHVNPDFNATTYSRDAAILELKDRVSYTEYVRPVCLWPENEIDLRSVIGKKGSVVGWGFDETGVSSEELALVEMPVVDQETCLRSYDEFFVRYTSAYTFCAGYRDGTSVCNGDSGGGMVFKSGGRWYLRGLVSLSVARHNENRCDPSHYVIFTDLAKFLPWIKQIVYDF